MKVQKRKNMTVRMATQVLLHYVFKQFGQYLKDPISGEPLRPEDRIQYDHIYGRQFGGPHEYENFQPLLAPSHKGKTRREARDRGHMERLRKERLGKPKRKRRSRKLQSRGFDTRLTRHMNGTTELRK